MEVLLQLVIHAMIYVRMDSLKRGLLPLIEMTAILLMEMDATQSVRQRLATLVLVEILQQKIPVTTYEEITEFISEQQPVIVMMGT